MNWLKQKLKESKKKDIEAYLKNPDKIKKQFIICYLTFFSLAVIATVILQITNISDATFFEIISGFIVFSLIMLSSFYLTLKDLKKSARKYLNKENI